MIEPFYNSLWVILEWQNILAMLVGVIGGIIFGAIPGLTATMGIALLIPLTFGMSPLMALGMMAGIHNGGKNTRPQFGRDALFPTLAVNQQNRLVP